MGNPFLELARGARGCGSVLLQLGDASCGLGWVVGPCPGLGVPRVGPHPGLGGPYQGLGVPTGLQDPPVPMLTPPTCPPTEILKGGVLIERNPELCFQETILWSDILHRHNEFRSEIQVEATRTRSCECPGGFVVPGRGLGVPFQPPWHPLLTLPPCTGPDCRALCAEGRCWGESKQDCQTCECGAHRDSDHPQGPPKPLGTPFLPSICLCSTDPTWHPNLCPRHSLDLLLALPNCCSTEPYFPPKSCSQRPSGPSICYPKSLSHRPLFATSIFPPEAP